MRSLIEELYYSNLRLKNDSKEHQKKMANLSELLERNEKELIKCLDDQGKDLFEKFKDNYDELSRADECSLYMNGFLLGGRLMAEIMLLTTKSDLQD